MRHWTGLFVAVVVAGTALAGPKPIHLKTLPLRLPVGVLKAPRGMTAFNPAVNGFWFVNSFVNDFVPALDIHTDGLCGGMTYAVLDYYNAHQPIPNQDWRPANGTLLERYLYARQTDSIMSNLDKWGEVGFNPGGARNSEFFKWGLETKPGSRIAELRSYLDRGVPVALGLQGASGKSGNHQVLAIGYTMGRYKGNLGPYQEDFRIFICDPNYPRRTMRLAPDTHAQIWVERDENDQVVAGSGWQTYFVNRNYHPKTPPRIVNPKWPADGKVYELILAFQTGSDDLRGGKDNVNLTVNLTNGTHQFFGDINRRGRWINNYQETEAVLLHPAVLPAQISNVVISTTFSGGIGGDNWDMLHVQVRGKGGGTLDLHHLAQAGFHRFTGDHKSLTIPVTGAPIPAGTVNRLELKFWTGGDDLRGGHDNVNVTVRLRNGRQQVFRNVNSSQRWGNNTQTTVSVALAAPVKPPDIASVTISTTFSGGIGGDNWNMNGVQILAEGNGVDKIIGSHGYKRFTGSSKVLTIATSG